MNDQINQIKPTEVKTAVKDPLAMPDLLSGIEQDLTASGRAPAVIEPDKGSFLAGNASETARVQVTRPVWMNDEDAAGVSVSVEQFIQAVKANPSDIKLVMGVQKLGKQGADQILPHSRLFEKKIAMIMEERKEGSPVAANLLQVKQALDQVNPAVVEKQPITYKMAYLFKKTRLPKSDEVLDMIYAKRETVGSLVKGIEVDMATMQDGLRQNLVDAIAIYEGLLKGHRMIERDVYFGQMLQNQVAAYLDTRSDPIEKSNLEEFLAQTTTILLDLQSEQQANLQFFAGAQAIAKLTSEQIAQMSSLVRILKNSVLANLGLAVMAEELSSAVEMSGMLRNAIGETIASTGKKIRQTGEQITQSRAEASINIDGLRRGADELIAFFEQQEKANRDIITKGAETSRALSDLSNRLTGRVEGGHGSMNEFLNDKQ